MYSSNNLNVQFVQIVQNVLQNEALLPKRQNEIKESEMLMKPERMQKVLKSCCFEGGVISFGENVE